VSADGGLVLPLPTLPPLPLPIPIPTVPGSSSTLPATTAPATTVPGSTAPVPSQTTVPPATSTAPPNVAAPPTANPPTSTATPPAPGVSPGATGPSTTSPGGPTTTSGTSTECAGETTTSSSAPESSSPESSPPSTDEPVDVPTTECETPVEDSAADPRTTLRRSELSDGDHALTVALARVDALAVHAYSAVQEVTTAGNLSDVPPAVSDFVAMALAHHQADLDEWNTVMTAAGRQRISAAPLNLTVTVNETFRNPSVLVDVIAMLVSVETTAAATYLHAIGSLESPSAISLAGSVYAIDRQHLSVLLFFLGRDPVPDTFASAEFAYVSADPP
jgi:Ferritin-like domain